MGAVMRGRHFRLAPAGNRARSPRERLQAMVRRDRERTEHLSESNPRRRPTLAPVLERLPVIDDFDGAAR
jgi:hypothetical protein